MGLESTTHNNFKAMPINGNDYSCHITAAARTCSTDRMESISRHITPLVNNTLGGGHTNTHTYTDICTETISGALALGRHAWFKKLIFHYRETRCRKYNTMYNHHL